MNAQAITLALPRQRVSIQQALGNPALWQRIEQHPIAGAANQAFIRRLARENAWSQEFSVLAMQEYKRYCYLQCGATGSRCPSHAVDQVWHLHLLYTRDYWHHFCPEVLQRELHHVPSNDGATYLDQDREHYAQTLADYEQEFGAAPAQIWPDLKQRFNIRENWQWRNTGTTQFKNAGLKHSLGQLQKYCLHENTILSVTLIFLALIPPYAHANPLEYSGFDFLWLYLKGLLGAGIAGFILLRLLNSKIVPVGELMPEEIALLSGGAVRVLDALEVHFLASGQLQYSPLSNELTVGNDARKAADHFLAQQLCKVRNQRNQHDRVAQRALEAQVVTPIAQKLEAQGLLLSHSAQLQIGLLSCLPILALMFFGGLKVMIGLSRSKPVSFLVALLALSAVVCLITYLKRPRVSAGVGPWLRAHQQKLKRLNDSPTKREWPNAVALFGMSALTGTALASYASWRQPPSDSSSSSGDSDSSSDSGNSDSGDGDSGSSDSGGGDSGGGGCGGCGGGGD